MEKPLKKTIALKNFCSPYLSSPKHFCYPVFFSSPRMIFYSQKILQKHFAGKTSSPKESASVSKTCYSKFLPKKFLPKRICSPFCSPNFYPKEFAPWIFPPQIFFALHITSHNEILLANIPPKYFCWRNFLPTRICSSKTCFSKFPPKKICLKKNLFPILPQMFIQKNMLPKFFLPTNLLSNYFALHITSHKKLLPKFRFPKIFALWSSYGAWLEQVQWQGMVQCM